VELRISLIATMNSCNVISVLFDIEFHLFEMLSSAYSIGTFMNSEITSRDVN